MRRSLFALAGLAVFLSATLPKSALATVGGAAVAKAWSRSTPIESAQYYDFDGVDYCWYDQAWQGPGWYWCGYDWIYGYGWGGGYGWNGWGGGGYYWRHHHHDHDHDHDHNHGVWREGPPRQYAHMREGLPGYDTRVGGHQGARNYSLGPLPQGPRGGSPNRN